MLSRRERKAVYLVMLEMNVFIRARGENLLSAKIRSTPRDLQKADYDQYTGM